MKYILPSDTKASEKSLGGKAARLRDLMQAGFNVPDFLVVTPETFELCLPPADAAVLRRLTRRNKASAAHSHARSRNQASPPDAAPSGHEIDSALQALSFPERLRIELDKTLLETFGKDVLLAVRSSAADEDGQLHSFAGQLDSYLSVPSHLVADRIIDVWRSGYSQRLLEYRRLRGIDEPIQPAAVLIQRQIDARWAGVAFSRDPVGASDNTVVTAVSGLADKLVSGAVDGVTFMVGRDGAVKREATATGLAAPDAIGAMHDSQPAADEIKSVARLAIECERLFGSPQDIEWVVGEGGLFIVQSRPITNLRTQRRFEGTAKIFDSSNIGESYQGVTTPLTFSFARKAYEHVYLHFVRIMGVPERRINENRGIFPNMLGFIQGRIYYNLINWYRLLAMLPGFRINRKFMEKMMGVKEELPHDIVRELDRKRTSDYVFAFAGLVSLVFNLFTLEIKVRRFRSHFNKSLAAVPARPDMASLEELAAMYRKLESSLISRWDAPLINDFFAMIFFGLLEKLTFAWMPGVNSNALLVGTGGVISTEPARLMDEMAAVASETPSLVGKLIDGSIEEIMAEAGKSPRFDTLYRSYLAAFGDRCVNELKLESPTLTDNPLPLLRNVGQLAKSGVLKKSSTIAREISSSSGMAISQATASIKTLTPIRRMIYSFVLKQARTRIQTRENLRFERTRLFGTVRRLFVCIGRKLEDLGVVASKNDVFFLEVEEVLGFIEGTASTYDLAGLVNLRRKENDSHHKAKGPPDRIETRALPYEAVLGSSLEGADKATMSLQASGDKDEMKGIGCCPGIVRGRVRVVLDPASCAPIDGEILVAKRTDPGWILHFAQAKGILVEHGSLLSHTAIVSRELNIPAIVSIRGLTAWLKDGDLVEFDGTSGQVRRLEPQKSTNVIPVGDRATIFANAG